jgi:hypothetical protein
MRRFGMRIFIAEKLENGYSDAQEAFAMKGFLE